MTYPPYLREKARELRVEKKLTIDEIAERLRVGRTTVYYWTGDLVLPPTPRQRAAAEAASHANRIKHQRLRDRAYAEGRESFEHLASDPTFRDFVSLYIAEGYKKARHHVALGNSDPAVVKLAHDWISQFAQNKISFTIQYDADQSLNALKNFWSAELNIDPADIKFQRKSNSGKLNGRKWRSRYGVLTIRTGDTLFRARLQGWMDCMEEQWLHSLRSGV
jgi:hypothetical protein